MTTISKTFASRSRIAWLAASRSAQRVDKLTQEAVEGLDSVMRLAATEPSPAALAAEAAEEEAPAAGLDDDVHAKRSEGEERGNGNDSARFPREQTPDAPSSTACWSSFEALLASTVAPSMLQQ